MRAQWRIECYTGSLHLQHAVSLPAAKQGTLAGLWTAIGQAMNLAISGSTCEPTGRIG